MDDFLSRWESSVLKFGDKAAIVGPGRTLTYRETDRISDSIAVRLEQAGAGAEKLVVLSFRDRMNYVPGMIAALKVGAGFLIPNDISPQRYLSGRHHGIEVVALLHDSPSDLPDDVRVEKIGIGSSAASGDGKVDWRSRLASDSQLAYVLFTSGSTGTPKGVMIERGNLAGYCKSLCDRLSVDANDIWFGLAAPSFDVFLEECLPILTAGGTFVLPSGGVAPNTGELHRELLASRSTLVEMTTQHWYEYIRWLARNEESPPGCLRYMIVGGEKMDASVYREWQRRFRTPLAHVYGITETTITSNLFFGDALECSDDVPVGDPLGNSGCSLGSGDFPALCVDREILLSGRCVGRGYLGDPSGTAESFIPDPAGPPGSRRYRTGDLGAFDGKGNLLVLGRNDDLIKIRGHRIGRTLIEKSLLSTGLAQQAVVAPDPRVKSNIMAYLVPHGGKAGTGAPELMIGRNRSDLVGKLSKLLPYWAIPGRIFLLDSLPTTLNGKVDRHRLGELGLACLGKVAEEVLSDLESRLLEIFRRLLNDENVQMKSDFFDHGGDSLLALSLVEELWSGFGVEVSLASIFEFSTPQLCARLIAGEIREEAQIARG